MSEPRRIAFRITGRVQGVGFRWWTRQRALELGLRGTVRNAADGSVEVVAAGPAEAVAAFRQDLARGPSSARVREVKEADAPLLEGDVPDDFRIVH